MFRWSAVLAGDVRFFPAEVDGHAGHTVVKTRLDDCIVGTRPITLNSAHADLH